jgi:hypothetical protein
MPLFIVPEVLALAAHLIVIAVPKVLGRQRPLGMVHSLSSFETS